MIKVLIAGNTRIYRDGLTKALGDHPDLQICGVAANETETEAALRSAKPDVLLVDILMSQALRIVRAVPAIDPEIKIVVLAIADEDAEILAWAEAGVSGFVTRENTLDQLASSIIASARGELACSPRHAATLLHHVARLSASPRTARQALQRTLTRRQANILDLVSGGLSNKEIALRLGIEVTTVKNHVHQLLGKLNVKRRSDAAAIVHEAGNALEPQRTPSLR